MIPDMPLWVQHVLAAELARRLDVTLPGVAWVEAQGVVIINDKRIDSLRICYGEESHQITYDEAREWVRGLIPGAE